MHLVDRLLQDGGKLRIISVPTAMPEKTKSKVASALSQLRPWPIALAISACIFPHAKLLQD
jgi:hypothetical protein